MGLLLNIDKCKSLSRCYFLVSILQSKWRVFIKGPFKDESTANAAQCWRRSMKKNKELPVFVRKTEPQLLAVDFHTSHCHRVQLLGRPYINLSRNAQAVSSWIIVGLCSTKLNFSLFPFYILAFSCLLDNVFQLTWTRNKLQRLVDPPKEQNIFYFEMTSLIIGLLFAMLISMTFLTKNAECTVHASEICDSCSTPTSKWLCMLPDKDLYEGGIQSALPYGTKGCRIADARKCRQCACDYYVKAFTKGPAATGSYDGWPRTVKDGVGTGCVKTPYSPRRVGICYFRDSRYQLTTSEVAVMCSSDGSKNALAQLRHALCKGQCGI